MASKSSEKDAAATAAAMARAAGSASALQQATSGAASAQAQLSAASQRAAQATAQAAQSAGAAAASSDAALAKMESRLASAKAKIDSMSAAKVDTSGMDQYVKMLEGSIRKRKEALANGTATPDAGPKAAIDGANASADRLIGKKKAIRDVLGGALGNLAGSASAVGGPLGMISDKVQGLASIVGKGGAAGGVMVLATAYLYLATAALAATLAVSAFVLACADAARSAKLLNNAAAGSAKGGAELSMVIGDIASRSPLAKAKIEEMGRALELAGLKGRRMQVALEMIAMIESAVPGAGAKIQALAEQFQKVKRAVLTKADLAGTGLALDDVAVQLAKTLNTSVANAKAMLQNGTASVDKVMDAMQKAIDKKFGKTVAAQMMSLGVQFEKMKENIAGLFADVDIEEFLTALKSITDLFSQNNAVGKALRPLLSGMFTTLFAAVAKVMPFLKGFIIGIVVVVVMLYTWFLKTAKVVASMFGGGAVDKAQMLRAGLIAGKVAIVLFIAALVVMGVVLMAIASILVVITAFFLLPLIAIAALVAGIYMAADALGAIDLADAAFNVVQSFIGGLNVGLVVAAFSDLGNAAKAALHSALGIASPSKVALAAADNVTSTFAGGVEDGTGDTDKAFAKMVDPKAVKGAAKKEKGAGKVIYIEHHGSDGALEALVRVCMRDGFEVEMLGAET